MLLEKLVRGKEPSAFVLLEDSLECPALPLLREAVAAAAAEPDHVVLVLVTDTPASVLVGGVVSVENRRRIRVFDAYSDPYGWAAPGKGAARSRGGELAEPEPVTCLDDPRLVTDALLEALRNAAGPQGRFTLVIDSVEPFLRRPAGIACLKRLVAAAAAAAGAEVRANATAAPRRSPGDGCGDAPAPVPPGLQGLLGRVVAVHHGDVPVPPARRQSRPGDGGPWSPPRDKWLVHAALAYFATSRVEVRHGRRLAEVNAAAANGARRTWWPPEDAFEYFGLDTAEPSAVCVVEHSRRSGKVAREVNGFRVEADETVTFLSEDDVLTAVRQHETKRGNKTLDGSVDPTADLSFNLTLTDDQREAKSKVALPYLKAQEQGAGGGTIFYAPDAADDFDEDDPDDDLDI